MKFKSGYVAILGLPNAGKSTLMNTLLGQKLSITNKKPQTTRKRILGIRTDNDHQIVFLDTPGILQPAYLLQEKMMEWVDQSVKDADVILLIIDISNDPNGEKTLENNFIYKMLLKVKKPIILVMNKVDLTNQEHIKLLITKFEQPGHFHKLIPISATLGFNIPSILTEIVELLPEHPKYYPDDRIADENERFFVSEIIRENILEQYQEEIPYSCEVIINEFKEREEGKDFIQAEILVERDSQKGIIIGKGGEAIKKLGQKSRKAIEEFLQREVFLDLRVKVRANWRTNENYLKNLGYDKDIK